MVKEIDIISRDRIISIIKSSELPIKKKEIIKILEYHIKKQEIEEILDYLEITGKIFIGKKGIVWVEASNEIKELLNTAVEV